MNERHYGALMGLSKDEAGEEMGHERVLQWRKSWNSAPPMLSHDDMYHWHNADHAKPMTIVKKPGHSNTISTEKGVQAPRTESLADCARRILPLWNFGVVPRLLKGETVLIVAHANSIRSMLKHLDGELALESLRRISIPSAVPLVYDFQPSARDASQVEVVGTKSSLGMRGRYLSSQELLTFFDYDVTPDSAGMVGHLDSSDRVYQKPYSSSLSDPDLGAGKQSKRVRMKTGAKSGSTSSSLSDPSDSFFPFARDKFRQKPKEEQTVHAVSKDCNGLEEGGMTFQELIESGYSDAISYAQFQDEVNEEYLEAARTTGTFGKAGARIAQNKRSSSGHFNIPHGEALVITDNKGKVTHVNQTWVDLCGFTLEDMQRQGDGTSAVLQGPESDISVVQKVNDKLTSSLPVRAKIVNYRKSGEAFLNDFTVLPIFDTVSGKRPKEAYGTSGEDTSSTIVDGVDPLRPTHFIARLEKTPNLPDCHHPALTSDQMDARRSGEDIKSDA
jgi:bisphosphoglycerate-dependent phosphoglycerate mutase family 1